MNSFSLSISEKEALKAEHKSLKGKQGADRIKATLLLSEGYSYTKVANILLLDEGTIRNYETRYKEEGISGLLENNYKGSQSKLSDSEKKQLDAHLQTSIGRLAPGIRSRIGQLCRRRGRAYLVILHESLHDCVKVHGTKVVHMRGFL